MDLDPRRDLLPRGYRELESPDGAEGISLEPIVAMLRQYWKVITLALGLALLVSLTFALVTYIRAPRNSFSRLQFRLEFTGIEQGKYPNGTPFSMSEITSAPVLRDVYDRNSLQQYVPFDTFKNSAYVVESSPELMMLELDYQARLSNTNLNQIDRERIESEYRGKRDSQARSGYSLNLQRAGDTVGIPDSVVAKVLNDILIRWAEDAVGKGVLKYQTEVYSPRVVDVDGIRSEDYLVATDQMRAFAQKIITNIDTVSQLPGATVIRANDKGMTLAELRVTVSNVLEFRLQPLIGTIVANGLYRSGGNAASYIESKLTEAREKHREAQDNTNTLRAALGGYVQQRDANGAGVLSGTLSPGVVDPRTGTQTPGVIAQLGESFIDRLVQLSSQGTDVAFRQNITERMIAEGLKEASNESEVNFYQNLLTRVRTGRTSNGVDINAIRATTDDVLKRLTGAVADLNAIYEAVSARNLSPGTLFTVSSPPDSLTQRAVQPVTLLGYSFLAVLLVGAVTLLACVFHWKLRREHIAHSTAPTVERDLV